MPIPSPAPGVRLDVLLERVAEGVVRGALEPRVRNLPLWDLGLGEVIATAIKESRIPSEPITAVHVARRLGILRGVES
jgi:hypothetical protein